MTSIEEADSWIGRTALDSTPEQIGTITQIWVGDASGHPEWASLKVIGLRGREALVPLAGSAAFGGGRRFAYSKEDIVDAPRAAEDGSLASADIERLASYYGAPERDPESRAATWVDRMEDAADGATVREITSLHGPDHSAPPTRPPAAEKAGRRFGRGRKAASTDQSSSARVLRGNASRAGQEPAEPPVDHDEASVGH
jgi:hypothetical protein